MEFERFSIEGPVLIKLKKWSDDRGWFCERYREDLFESQGLPSRFVQDNFSTSKAGVVRGLHFQSQPAQGKLVSCTRGVIFDVAVDIRSDSSTYGKHIGVILDSDQPSLFWVPPGFAHGFQVISSNSADVFYKVTELWNSKSEGCLLWNDPELKISWPSSSAIVSPKDQQGQLWSSFRSPF